MSYVDVTIRIEAHDEDEAAATLARWRLLQSRGVQVTLVEDGATENDGYDYGCIEQLTN